MQNPEKDLKNKKSQAEEGGKILKSLGLEQWADSNLKPKIRVEKNEKDVPDPGLTAGAAMYAALKGGRKHGGKGINRDMELPKSMKEKSAKDEDLGDEWGYHQGHGE